MKFIPMVVIISCFVFFAQAVEQDDGSVKGEHALSLIEIDLDSAEEMIIEAISDNPHSAKDHFYCGRIMGRQASHAFFSALKYAKKSLACLQKAVALAPKNVDYRKGLINFYLGAPSIAGGDKQAALEQVNVIKQLDSSQGVVVELDYYRKIKELPTLEKRLVHTLTAEPQSAIVHYQYGLLLQQTGDYNRAQSHFALASEQGENREIAYEALYQLGRNAVFAEDFISEGIAALQHYLTIENSEGMPSNSWAHYRLSQLYTLYSQNALAHKHRLLAADTDDKDLLNLLET